MKVRASHGMSGSCQRFRVPVGYERCSADPLPDFHRTVEWRNPSAVGGLCNTNREIRDSLPPNP